ncbi:ATP-dependent DNA ligase [Microbacterium sp. NPDC057407]|uniref:DUF7882 family protein n=1 Tax=Microbacterium sp. NPDC057407 TaxID=3346120 RepID=UPI003671DC77
MGRFIYDASSNSVDIEDRTLAHIRLVIMNKLRRGEPFMFDVDMGDGSGRRSYWIHPAIPLQFHFFGGRQPQINRRWLEAMMQAASGPRGLTIIPELEEPMAPSRQIAAPE